MPPKPDDKWLHLSADQPAVGAARHALAVRLATIVSHVEPPDEDPEHVHQLRVAARRAAAVLRLFAPCFPGKKRRRARKRLHDLRRAAGDARDWDVFLQAVAADDRLKEHEQARTYLLGYAAGCRAAAREKLRAAAGDANRIGEAFAELREGVRPPKRDLGLTAGRLGAAELRSLYDDLADGIAARPATPDELHRLRIAGKRLRYAIEVFAGCFAPALKDVIYPAVEALQETLGTLQDAHVAVGRLTAIAAGLPEVVAEAVRPGLAAYIRSRRADVAAGREAFAEWADAWQRAIDQHPVEGLLTPVP